MHPVRDGKQQRPAAQLKTLIVDDEELARRGLRLRLERYPDIVVAGEARNGREALTKIAELEPDLVFLDIQMPGMDGFDVIRNLQDDGMPLVVFITAFDQFAVRAFEVHAVDYLLKPAEDRELARALDRARGQLLQQQAASHKDRLLAVIGDITGREPAEMEAWLDTGGDLARGFPDRLTIRDGGNITLLPMTEIDWVDAAGDYMCIHAADKVHVMRITMKELESLLDPVLFQRVHRSTIVNRERVREISPHCNGEFFLHLSGGARLKMSRNYRDKLQSFL